MPAGRPRKEFDKEQFEKLCGLQCTEEEIEGWFGISRDTLTRRLKEIYGEEHNFSSLFKIYRQDGKIAVRRNQMRLCEKYPNMAIWLGKQYLGQKDNELTDRDKQLAETTYEILTEEEKDEAKELLKEFEA